MAKRKTNIINTKSERERWNSGEFRPLRGGEVVRFKGNEKQIAVVGAPGYEPGTYDMKLWHGPKPWDFSTSVVHFSKVFVVDEPNPTKYTASDRYPGPANAMIKRINEAHAKRLDEKFAKRTSKDIDRELGIMEEEKTRTRIMDSEEKPVIDPETEDVDSVVSEDDDGVEDELVNPVDIKRMTEIEEA